MFKVNLEQELVMQKRSSLSKKDLLAFEEAKKILKETNEKDLEILQKMGLNHSIVRKQSFDRIFRLKAVLNPERFFTQDDIKTLCVRYGLRFLNIQKYRGEVDPQLPSKVREFEESFKAAQLPEENSHYTTRYDHSNFMICAPEESFELRTKSRDPLLFYPIGGGIYYLVHKWGKDISVFRAIKAWRFKNYWTFLAFCFSVFALPAWAIVTAVTGINIWFALFSIPTAFIITAFAAMADSSDWLIDRLWNNRWNSGTNL